MNKKLLVLFIFHVLLLTQIHFYELKTNEIDIQKNTIIGLTINGSSTDNFPSKDSGLTVDSIVCDKGSSGEWDYENWGLKIKNITQSRTKCQINFISRYKESVLNGTDPVLKDGLIPVTISNDGTVRKADTTKEWYRYEKQQWANAVILENESTIYQEGEEIPESNIESYFVWIPRYQYKIWNIGNYDKLTILDAKQVHQIEIIFGMNTTIDSETECKTPNVSGESGTCSIGKYMTHPAFLAFDTESSITKGLWVGKFETGYKGATSVADAQKNENNPNKIQIKPNVYSWRGIQVANAYLSSYNYKREYDSHMMKNTEWGAVAYLQHSAYGSHTSVRINNNSEYKTGYSSVNEPSCGYTATNEVCNRYGTTSDITNLWNTEVGVKASTTGNITGIYDMAGGAHENVMGIMISSDNKTLCSGRDITYNSGFNGVYCNVNGSPLHTMGLDFPSDSKYYDVYTYSTDDKTNQRRILGDATGEMGPFSSKMYGSQPSQIGSWYSDESLFVNSNYPWFIRGSHWTRGESTGVFAYHHSSGPVDLYSGFRIVLATK